MSMKLQHIICLLIAGITISCEQKQTNEIETITFPHISDYSLAEQLNINRFIQLETNDNCLIGEVTDILCTKDNIYILDFRSSKSLFEFDKNGKFIKKLCSVGNGPGEFVLPRSFAIDEINMKLFLLDVGVGKVLEYNLKTFEFVREMPINGISLFYNNDRLYTYDSMSEVIDNNTKDYHVHCYDVNFNYIESCVPIVFETGYISGPNRRFSVFDNKVRFIPPFSDQVIEISESTAPLYKLKFEQGEVPPRSFLESNKENLPRELMAKNYINQFNIMENSLFLFVPYASNNDRYFGIYDKTNKKSLSFHHSDKSSWISEFSPIGMDNKNIVFYSFGDNIVDYKDLCPENLKSTILKRENGDNPIIMFASIKHIDR